jgi:serpin B
MRSCLLASIVSLLALAAPANASATPPGPPPAPTPTPTTTVASANVDFDFAMYGALRGKQGNLFFSAPSMRQALGIAYLGARGTTASEMSNALHFDADRAKSAASAKDELGGWQAARGASQLAIANRLWADQGFEMNGDFVTTANGAYGSAVEPVDFSHAPNPARLTINGWVAKQTNDKIKDLLPPPSITSDTRLVITNAIWFKGTWEKTFDKKQTRDAAFHVDATTKVDVPTMHQTSVFGFASVPGAKVLEMPYGKSDLAMDVVLPDDPNGLSKIEEKLTSGTFATWTSSLAKRKVVVAFPKVTFTWGGSVKPELKALGMKTAFTPSGADFTGIAAPAAAGGSLYVSDVFHKAFVAIDEEGTEAAAATAVIIARESAAIEPPPVRFEADHPFVFVIRDVKRGRILFMGRVTNPKA